ncbi:betaine--homocysteine S-methyltransferase 1-like isoform X11 [Dreissena polymorpha]|uniref:Hcy-binding domain-containing protein n=1 Tax=Dreissena polymorpha TaxID=45954 RepID=A0A9D4INK9_DREPO|nr:betaine--homocysteine S-methyltransferase 1-like isoform X1 [Dreissena polymorpha]XP_052225947.1 betaine--homocysteine S-methyltransferase 1-like isoform X2 [Dreissena polymorpha]XP_052225949.1 betaine--homocysteine S-methyltransferase 1-like isoform X3 [Dreissena polymorpha]XP_052225950.1 betaine--homocysteine S-methyltransferase 1-like isoform X4 [Dreissena polymorpha]XP_052225951.1 betaine--homocysteine S-methyltransferase 1-like isoform X5 [Dreissena polymorpha]XP_052225952.1 betaine--h
MAEENAFLKRLKNGGNLVVAEGYIFEFERKGYLQAGTFVPEVIIEHPELVRHMYEEFVHAGSEVVLAFTYYAHREKLRLIGRENDLDAMNRSALQMAREVADKHGCLMAGNISNTTAYVTDDPESHKKVEEIFKEQIEIAVEYNADYIVGETFGHFGEAMLALESIKKYGKGLPAVVTISAPATETLIDGVTLVDACKRLEDAGAAVVGLNCGRGPETMIPAIREIKKVCKGPVAALPVTYRTTPEEPTFFSLTVPGTKNRAFPLELCTCLCSRKQIADFAAQCRDLGVEYVGLCCGNSANMTRIVAETYGRSPPASRYAPAMEKHFIFGEKAKFKDAYTKDMRAHIGGDFD